MKCKWLIVLSLSLAFGLNHLFGLFSHSSYTPFALTGVSKGGSLDEAYCYVPPINAVRFKKPLGDWQAFEYRLSPPIQPTLGPLIFGQVAKLIGLENLYMVVDFIFPPLVFLIFYYLLKLITKSELLSVLAPLVLIGKEPLQSFTFKLGVSLVKYKQLDYFIDYLNNLNRPLSFARFDSPQFSFLIFVLGLIMLFKALKSKRVVLYLITGFLFGLQWYLYSYYAVFLVLVLASLFFLLLIQRDWLKLKYIIVTGFVAVTTSVFYWLNYLAFNRLPQTNDFLYRAGRVDGRWFDKNSLVIAVFILGLLFIKSKLKTVRPMALFILSLLLAAFLCLNLQLVTGFSVQHFHWQSVIVAPILILASFYLLSFVKSKLLFKPGYLLIFLLTAAIFFRNLLIAANTAGAYVKNAALEQAFDWINDNLENDAVIMTPSLESNYWLIMKTKAYVYNPHALHSLASTKELIDRLAITFSIFKIDADYAGQFLNFNQTPGAISHTHQSLDLTGYDYLFYIQHGLEGPQSPQANEEVDQARFAFQKASPTLAEARDRYRLDYLFVGPSEKRLSRQNFMADQNLIKVFDNQAVQIYRLF